MLTKGKEIREGHDAISEIKMSIFLLRVKTSNIKFYQN